MLRTRNLDSELKSAIALLNEAQKQAMLAVANAFVQHEKEGERYRWEDDPDFVAELDARCADYKNGGKMYSSAEMDVEVRALLQTFKSK